MASICNVHDYDCVINTCQCFIKITLKFQSPVLFNECKQVRGAGRNWHGALSSERQNWEVDTRTGKLIQKELAVDEN